jgi:hypothetical protein
MGVDRLDDFRGDLAAGPMTHVDLFVGPQHDLVHTSLVLTGLCSLASRGDISLAYRHAGGAEAWLAGDPMVIVFDLHADKTIRVALDLRDGEGLSQPIVERADVYFKRAFYPVECERVPQYRLKMLPFGFNYGCRSRRSTVRLLASVGGAIALTGRSGIDRLKQYLLTPGQDVFELTPGRPAEPLVAFQTRLWTPEEVAQGESEPLNAERLATVRALKKAFGRRFVGGLVPTAFARQHYPEDLTPHSSKYADYLRIKKRCLVSVYTRGVEHSLAFKLGETFAASQCLVSVPLRYSLPVPIEIGRHYLEFEGVDACVAACERLLADPALAQLMRRANHEYYQREIEPAAKMTRVLERVSAWSQAS